MKKFFTLFCAIAIALCASAAPIAPKAELAKKAPVAVEQMQKVQIEKAQFANFNQLSAAPALKVINQKPQASAVKPAARKLATGEPIVVIIDGTPSIYPAGNVQAITVIGKDNMIYAWGVKAASLETGKTYAFTDMDMNYTYRCSQDYLTTYEDPTDATFSIDAENNITASIVTESGTYLVYTNDPTPPQPSYDTIPVMVASYQEKYYASSLDWQVIMADAAGNGYSFDIFAPAEGFENGKTYTSDNGDFDLDYTFAQVNKVNDAAVKASFTKTETEDALTVTAEMTTAGNHVYQITYVLDKTVEIVDAHGIIIQPAKGETKEYNRLATNTCFYNNSGTKLAYQSGTATLVECADGTVYWQNPVSKYTTGAWIKGKKEGSTITFATKQPVYYSSQYKITLSVRWGNFNTQKFAVADDYADSFILDIKGDSLIMRGTQATTGSTATYFPGVFYDDDDSFGGYGDCGVNLYIPGWTPSTELITPPAGLVTVKMPFTGSGVSEEYADSVLVGWDNDTVYIQGLAVDFKTAWIKGVLKEGVVTFEKFQYVGKFNGTMPIWVLGTNAESELLDFTMTYDAQANLFKATNIFVVNASYEKIYYLDKVSKIVIGEVAQADWGEWEDFAPFGFNTGTWTFTAMATSPKSYSNYVALVRTDKNNADNKQIKITNWGEGWFGEGVELIINWNAKDNTCSIDKQYTGYTDKQYGKVSISSVEDGTYNPETGTFSIKVDYTVSAGSFGNGVETYVMDTKQPGLPYDTDAPFDAEFNYNDMKASIKDGVISISVNNGEKTIGLELYADPAATEIPAGVYTISDTQEAGTALQSVGLDGNSLTKCYAGTVDAGYVDDCWFMVKGTITLSYDEYGKLKVVVDAENSYGQPVTALVKYEKLEPKSVVTIEADNMIFNGIGTAFMLDAANADYEVVLAVMSNDTAGTYGVDDLMPTISYIYSAAGQLSILDGEFTLALNGKDMTLTGSLLASDTIQYNLNITGYMGALLYDQKSNYEATFELDSADVQTATTGTDKTQMQIINDDNQVVMLQFFAKADGKKLPAGTYPINDTEKENTVMASQGVVSQKYTPSFAGTLNNAGQVNAIWFMVGGEVVVAEDGSITVNAVNSYDKTITINIVAEAPITGLYRINANTAIRKALINGHVVIFKNDKTFNLMGAEL